MKKLPQTLSAIQLQAADVGAHIDRRAVLYRSLLSEPIEMLESESWRISTEMASGTAFIIHVIDEAASNGALGAILHPRKIYVCRRIRCRFTHEDFIHLYAAPGRRRSSRVSKERQKSYLGENARPFGCLREGIASPLFGR